MRQRRQHLRPSQLCNQHRIHQTTAAFCGNRAVTPKVLLVNRVRSAERFLHEYLRDLPANENTTTSHRRHRQHQKEIFFIFDRERQRTRCANNFLKRRKQQ